jgi:hypothetical protein
MNTNTRKSLIAPTDMGILTLAAHWGLTPFLMIMTGVFAVALVVHMIRSTKQEGIF